MPDLQPRSFDGVEHALFLKCSEECIMKYALGTAVENCRRVRLLRHGSEVDLEPYARDLPRPTGKILGDAATMGRSGGMC